MKKLCLILFFLGSVFAQEQNNVYLELFGNGGIYSINYERNLINSLNGRVGYMYTSEGEEYISSIPILLNYHLNTNDNNYVEFGIGLTLISGKLEVFWNDDLNVSDYLLTGTLGYCINPSNAINFRIAFTPFFDRHNGGRFMAFGGLSLGYKF